MTEREIESMVEEQVSMNSLTWKAFLGHGVKNGQQLALDFRYCLPDRDRAEALKEALKAEMGYEAVVEPRKHIEGEWIVRGNTEKMTLTLEILDQWVEDVIRLGGRNDAPFHGWGIHP
jgi:regulator of RNase E activity RraB